MKNPVKKDSKILREVKELIKSGRDSFICCAISNVTKTLSIPKYYHPLRKWVQDMIGGDSYYNTLEYWLSTQGIMCKGVLQRELRLQWLDWMIAYCETEELHGKVISFRNTEACFFFYCENGAVVFICKELK